jgi:alpha-mannosidase
MIRDKTMHLIGSAHLDPVWLWRWQEGYEAARATFESALDRMDENPDFIFTSSQAAVYKWIAQGDPALLERIKKRVEEGRWHIVGGWWMQTDCNIPSGESFVRQGLLGQLFFMENLGVMAKVGYNVDSFGHNLMLPQILKKCGMDSYVFMRPGPHENPDIPEMLFWWKSPDGSRILTFKIPETYTAWGDSFEELIRKNAGFTNKYPHIMQFYGVGNHGGGPTKDNLERISKLQNNEYLPNLQYSSPNIFFDALKSRNDDYPVWNDDLQHHASGCYAVHSEIKKNNRKLESKLAAAELLSVYANINSGFTYPKADLTRAWEGVLFNQFHDIMAGTSIIEAYDDAAHLHGMAFQFAEEAITFSAGAISSGLNTLGDAEPIVVFNPTAIERDGYCEFELHNSSKHMRIVDDSGNSVPCQVLSPSAAAKPGRRAKLIFPASIPSAGYRMYRAFKEEDNTVSSLSYGSQSIENEYLAFSLDDDTGMPYSIYDKQSNLEFIKQACYAKAVADDSDTWSHNVFKFNNVIGKFEAESIQLIEEGPVRAALRTTSRYNNSTLVQEYRLYADADYIECYCEVDWHEEHTMLKLVFNTTVDDGAAAYEIPYGHIIRPANGEEEPGLSWIDLSNEQKGLCIINDAKYSYDVNKNTINVTVLRSPVYAHHDPDKLDEPHRRYIYMDQGVSSFIYRIVPHSGGWREAYPHKRAISLNSPLIGINVPRHTGTAPSCGSFISTDADNVIISAVKQAESNENIIVRCFETNGAQSDCSFSIPSLNLSWKTSINPYEIKTFMIDQNRVYETDMLERIISDVL